MPDPLETARVRYGMGSPQYRREALRLWDRPEHEPTYSLERQVARAFAEMGPERLAQLQAEWNK